MNRYFSLACGAALLASAILGMGSVAQAQTAGSQPFPDVPANHWAYEAVGTLQKDGIVTGNVDGLYQGRHAITRYEFALAVSKVFAMIQPPDMSSFAKDSDLQAFESTVNTKLAADEDATAAIQTLMDGFKPELDKIGQDNAAIGTELTTFEDRLAAVRAEQRRVRVHGEINSMFRDNIIGTPIDGQFLDSDGFPSGAVNGIRYAEGVARKAVGIENWGNTSAFAQPTFSNDILLQLSGPIGDAMWKHQISSLPVTPDTIPTTNQSATSSYMGGHRGHGGGFGSGDGAQYNIVLDWLLNPESNYNNTTSLVPYDPFSTSTSSIDDQTGPTVKRAYAFFPIEGARLGCRPLVQAVKRIDLEGSINGYNGAEPKTNDYPVLKGLGGYGQNYGFDGKSFYTPGDILNVYQPSRNIEIDTNESGLRAGLFGISATPFTLKSDAQYDYFSSPLNNGNILIEGAGAKFNFKDIPMTFELNAGKLQYGSAFGGPDNFALSDHYRPGSISAGGLQYANPLDQIADFRMKYRGPCGLKLGATAVLGRVTDYSVYDYGTTFTSMSTYPIDPVKGMPFSNISVFGVDGSYPIPCVSGLNVGGEFAISQTGFGSRFSSVNTSDGNEAMYGHFDYSTRDLKLTAGYQEIYNNFAAPGYWGKIGDWTNPTNVKGPVVGAIIPASEKLTISTGFALYNGINNAGNESPLGSKDSLNSFALRGDYAFTKTYAFNIAYEFAQYNLKNQQDLLSGPGHPTEQYTDFGISHDFSKQSSIRFVYQYATYDDKDTNFDLNGSTRGNVVTMQLRSMF